MSFSAKRSFYAKDRELCTQHNIKHSYQQAENKQTSYQRWRNLGRDPVPMRVTGAARIHTGLWSIEGVDDRRHIALLNIVVSDLLLVAKLLLHHITHIHEDPGIELDHI